MTESSSQRETSPCISLLYLYSLFLCVKRCHILMYRAFTKGLAIVYLTQLLFKQSSYSQLHNI